MLSLRQNLTIILFFLLCSGVIVLSINLKVDEGRFSTDTKAFNPYSIESYFKRADYYLIGDGRDSFHLFSEELIHNQTLGELILTGPNGVVFSKKGEPLYYSGSSGFFSMKKHKLILKQNILIRSKEAIIKGDLLNYNGHESRMDVKGNVHTLTQNYDKLYEIRIKGDSLAFFQNENRLNYKGKVEGKVLRKRKFEQPVYFNADDMVFYMKTKKADMAGNVSLKKQSLTANARTGEMFFENYNKKLKYFALYDDVIVKELVTPTGKKPFERKAFSEKLEGYTSEGKVVLLGYPKVYQNNDVLKGNIIVLRENNETIEVDDANTNFIVE